MGRRGVVPVMVGIGSVGFIWLVRRRWWVRQRWWNYDDRVAGISLAIVVIQVPFRSQHRQTDCHEQERAGEQKHTDPEPERATEDLSTITGSP